MQRKASRFLIYWCLPCLVLSLALVAPARNTRNFGGDYRILQATEQGDNVELRISLRVINYSGADVQHATISLASSLATLPHREPFDWEKEQVPFKNLTLHFNEHKAVPPLVGTFTIPASEYERWPRGQGPNFTIAYRDASGGRRHEHIALVPRP
jgi:hypothetical protein